MNNFEFELKKYDIKAMTKQGELLAIMQNSYSTADPYYRYNDIRVYDKVANLKDIATKLKHLELFKLAKERYFKLKLNDKRLPVYVKNNNNVRVHMEMTLQEAYDWIKFKNQKD